MRGELAAPEADLPALRSSLTELCRALDSLRERLGHWERAPSQSQAPAQDLGAAPAVGIVQEILSLPSASLAPNDIYTLATDRASRLLAADRAMLFVGEPGGARLVPRSAVGFRQEDLQSASVRPGEGTVGRAFREGRVVARAADDDGGADQFMARFPVREAMAVPVRAGADIAGVLYVGRRRPGVPFGAADVLLLLLIADRVGDGLLRERLHSAHARTVQVEKARSLGEMAAGLARELNGIFGAILGKSRLLLARAHDEALREGLELLEETAWRGADVMHRLMALAAPASGEAPAPVDVSGLLKDVIALTRPSWKDEAEGRGARIEAVTDLEGAPPVRGSETALREALVNLVLNAVDAMPRGGRLTLATHAREGGVEITVEDTGEGIAEDVQGRVFDPFFSTRSPERMGLGLTLVQGVVTRHGGRIEISSAPGAGTRVVVWLPGAEGSLASAARAAAPPISAAVIPERHGLVDAPSDAEVTAQPHERIGERGSHAPGETRQREPAPTGVPRRGGASVLVLEDETPARLLLVEALTRAGYRVETATDGSSGLAKLESGPFDVVLADLALPQRSGLAVARSVKRLRPETPVVLITGWGHLLDPERLREHGVDLMLVKPFGIERVLSVVNDALRLRAPSA